MRIHTNLTNLTPARVASGAPIHFEHHEEKGSRLRDRAFEVRLGGSGGLNNTGLYGAGDYNGATWDEWGAFLGALFAADPDAVCGGSKRNPVYANAADFHWQTGNRFKGRPVEPGDCNCGAKYGWTPESKEAHFPGCATAVTATYLPADTHPRHRWAYSPGLGYTCTHKAGCSAQRPGYSTPNPHRSEGM
jgi:hypothetical protein